MKRQLKRFGYLIAAGSLVALAFSLALAQVPASLLKSGIIFGGTKAQIGSGLVLVEEHTASSSAELDFTTCISATYDDYMIRGVALVPATNNVSANVQYSTNGGSSYITTSSYQWGYGYLGIGFGAFSSVNSPGTDTAIQLVQGNANAGTATGGTSFTYNLHGPATGAAAAVLSQWDIVQSNQAPGYYREWGGGQISPAAAVNAFRVLFSSGNIATGTVRCYGLAK